MTINSNHVIICKNRKSFDKASDVFINKIETNELIIQCSRPKTYFRHFKKKFKIIKAAGGVVFNNDQELLVIKRNSFWDLPKGKIEKGEKRKIAAIREVEEECGVGQLQILSKIAKTHHIYLFDNELILKITYWFEMICIDKSKPVPQLEEDITEVQWIKKQEIDNIIKNTYKNLIELFEKLKSR